MSPETPALTISASMPLLLSARASFAGNASDAGRPKPAVSESPSATILTGRSCGRRGRSASHRERRRKRTRTATNFDADWTFRTQFPYDDGRRRETCEPNIRMNDTSRTPRRALIGDRAFRGESCARPRRGPRSYSQGYKSDHREWRGRWPGRAVGVGQIDAADGDGRS